MMPARRSARRRTGSSFVVSGYIFPSGRGNTSSDGERWGTPVCVGARGRAEPVGKLVSYSDLMRTASYFALVAWLGIVSGCSTKRCSGQPITCANQADHCQTVPGCMPVPGCLFAFTAVDTKCQEQGSQQTCEATTTSACAWAGQQCTSVCPSITDPQACDDFSFVQAPYPDRNFPCVWSACTGIPVKKFCDQYSNDQCPAALGCRVTEGDPVGT